VIVRVVPDPVTAWENDLVPTVRLLLATVMAIPEGSAAPDGMTRPTERVAASS